MTLTDYGVPEWVTGYLAPIVLLLGGIMALLIVATYLKDKESMTYKLMVGLGLVLGVAMVFLAVTEGYNAQKYTLILIAVAAFALIIRPFRDAHIAVIIALFVMAVIYIALGGLAGTEVAGFDLSFLASGWPRIIVAFVIAGLIFAILKFAEEIVQMFGKLFNFWPILLILGLLCIAEAVCQYMGYGSIFDYIRNIPWESFKV